MPVGMQIVNNDNVIQVDQNYRNMFLLNQQTFHSDLVDNATTFTKQTPIYKRTHKNSILAFDVSPKLPNALPIKGGNDYYAGNYYEAKDVMYGGYFFCITPLDPERANGETDWFSIDVSAVILDDPPSGFDVTIYEFGPLDSSDSKFGLQLYNADGQLVFDALKKPMRVADFYTLNREVMQIVSGQYYPIRGYAHSYRPYPSKSAHVAVCELSASIQYCAEFAYSSGEVRSSVSARKTWYSFHDSYIRTVQDRAEIYYDTKVGLRIGPEKLPAMLVDITNYK